VKDGTNKGNGAGSNEKGNDGNDGSRQSRSESPYKPSFSYPSYSHSCNTINHIANVTCLIEANSSEILSPAGLSDWLVDSAANAFITPYKSDLRF
jgi:hypothetical protein